MKPSDQEWEGGDTDVVDSVFCFVVLLGLENVSCPHSLDPIAERMSAVGRFGGVPPVCHESNEGEPHEDGNKDLPMLPHTPNVRFPRSTLNSQPLAPERSDLRIYREALAGFWEASA